MGQIVPPPPVSYIPDRNPIPPLPPPPMRRHKTAFEVSQDLARVGAQVATAMGHPKWAAVAHSLEDAFGKVGSAIENSQNVRMSMVGLENCKPAPILDGKATAIPNIESSRRPKWPNQTINNVLVKSRPVLHYANSQIREWYLAIKLIFSPLSSLLRKYLKKTR